MRLKDNKSKLRHYLSKLQSIYDLYNSDSLNISFDRLSKEKKVDYELLYFKNEQKEKKGIFVFSYDMYIKELKDQGIKKVLAHNVLNFRIHCAYRRLVEKDGELVSINEIISLMTKRDPTIARERILARLMSLAYYHGWNLKKGSDSIDNDYSIAIPSDFRVKMKQRFNLDLYKNLVDDREVQLFINIKGDLIFVFKAMDKFTKDDIKKTLGNCLKNEFGIKKILFE